MTRQGKATSTILVCSVMLPATAASHSSAASPATVEAGGRQGQAFGSARDSNGRVQPRQLAELQSVLPQGAGVRTEAPARWTSECKCATFGASEL